MGVNLEQRSGENPRENNRLCLHVNMTENGDERCERSDRNKKAPIIGKEKARPNVNNKVLDSSTRAYSGDVINLNSSKHVELYDGMGFDSKEEAFTFYKEYAATNGFAAVIRASRRSRISGKFIDAKFACTRYGNKRESGSSEVPEPVNDTDISQLVDVKKKRGRINRSLRKTDCKACMHVKRLQNGRWIVHSFLKEHNHELFLDPIPQFNGHRNLDLGASNIHALHAIRALTKNTCVTMSRPSGGCKKADKHKGMVTDQLYSKRHLAIEDLDAQAMLACFVNLQNANPNFFYAVDLNEEQCLRNVFWVDGKARVDYGNFRDVIFFDTTYLKNEYKLPFVSFIGVNHHSQFLLLGCALVADETKSTYIWLMQAWLRAMSRHAPKVILADQDESLKQAIAEVFSDTHHCFCLWHIFCKIPEKLSFVIRRHENFMKKFNKCIFKSWRIEEFERRWLKFVNRFDLSNDVWFQSLYEDRHRWVPTYMRNIFLAGMSTAQRLESMNCFLEKFMQRKTTLMDFFDQYKTVLRDKCEEEAKADFESWHKQPGLKSPSPFGKQMAALYTHAIFKRFQVEVLGVVACHPKKESENGFVKTFRVQDFEENQDFIVEWNEETSDISCLCRSFEFNGYLCRHVMIVLQMSGRHSIPPQYILNRWTKDAKSRKKHREVSDVDSTVQRYNSLCQQAFVLSDEGSLSQDCYDIASYALEEALRKCENVNSSAQLLSMHEHQVVEEALEGNSFSRTTKKLSASRKIQLHGGPEVINIGTQESWEQLGQSNSQEPPLNCSYESQESMRGMEQLNSRALTLESYFTAQQLGLGMGPYNSMVSGHDEYFSNPHSTQGLGQLNSIPDPRFLAQRMHGMVQQLNFRPQASSGWFDVRRYDVPTSDLLPSSLLRPPLPPPHSGRQALAFSLLTPLLLFLTWQSLILRALKFDRILRVVVWSLVQSLQWLTWIPSPYRKLLLRLLLNNCMLGMGSGQPNRLESLRMALQKAGDEGAGAARASDAFFPFAWNNAVEEACKSGVALMLLLNPEVASETGTQ